MTLWIVITAADLDAVAGDTVAEALRTAMGTPFADVMRDRVNYVRNRISGRVDVSATALSVPPELRSQTAALICEALYPRLMLDIPEALKNIIARAYKDLDIAGTIDFPISAASDGAAIDQAAGVSPSFHPRHHHYSRHDESGI